MLVPSRLVFQSSTKPQFHQERALKVTVRGQKYNCHLGGSPDKPGKQVQDILGSRRSLLHGGGGYKVYMFLKEKPNKEIGK